MIRPQTAGRVRCLTTIACLIAALMAALALLPTPALAQRFRRPVACDGCIANYFYYDEDATSGREDWNCGTSTYDGHRGTDFSLRGGLGAIADGQDVVAAAAGTVVVAVDGFYDRCTSCPAAGEDTRCGLGFGGGFGNFVMLEHEGGARTIYAHMRTGSVAVRVGDRVTCGQVLGEIGSSGCSTGAHLHFETRRNDMRTSHFDPFQGRCGASESVWNEQGLYRTLPGAACSSATPCPDGWYALFTCEGDERRRCIDGMMTRESCAPGRCISRPVGTDDACDADADGVATDEGDCDDRNPSIRPSATEVCGNRVDEDCDGADLACPPNHDASIALDARADAGAAGDVGPFDARLEADAALGSDAGTAPQSGGCGCRVAAQRRGHFHLAAIFAMWIGFAKRRRQKRER